MSENADRDRTWVENVVAADRAFRTTEIDAPTDDGSTVQDAIGSVDEGFDRAEERATITQAFRGRNLTDREQRMLVLRFVLDRTQYEIAEDIGQSQMQVSRLLRGLLQRLGDQGEDWRRAGERAPSA